VAKGNERAALIRRRRCLGLFLRSLLRWAPSKKEEEGEGKEEGGGGACTMLGCRNFIKIRAPSKGERDAGLSKKKEEEGKEVGRAVVETHVFIPAHITMRCKGGKGGKRKARFGGFQGVGLLACYVVGVFLLAMKGGGRGGGGGVAEFTIKLSACSMYLLVGRKRE